ARWRWGGGDAYCRQCRVTDQPCARGQLGETGKRCPEIEYGPNTEAEQAAWSAGLDVGVWRNEWMPDRNDPKLRSWRQVGMRMSEVVARHGQLDPDMIELLRAIETGAITGATRGWVDPDSEEEV
ncbi:MAG: hypothetical protein ABI740_09925, partial [Alphaproteobacteria bacterium]